MNATPPIRAALCGNQAWELDRVFARGRREELEAATVLFPRYVSAASFADQAPFLQEVEVLFSTWGMDAELARLVSGLPGLKAFFYAAGSVRHFARPLLDREIIVVSAWAANAVPVARFAFAQILLSLKGYFRNLRETRLPANRGRAAATDAPGTFGATVALLGCGMVGRTVAELLRPMELDVIVYDPFLGGEAAAGLGVRKVPLAEAFATAQVVSNHLADLPPTRGLLDRGLFASMRAGATFLNTGRGATVAEADLAQVLRDRPDLTALLDVTFPEPPAADSPWYALENALLSSHIAGSNGNEVVRMADYCLEEFAAWRRGRPLKYRVTREMLEKLA
ncbi:MAG TPA: hydroxyacid dehydrogenase [Fibrobacteria bacterium]|nr:hydroxyacid dehydrogenase [Fibrobacteria bacterium]